jgi:ABC-type sugar transport system ATPase subunit
MSQITLKDVYLRYGEKRNVEQEKMRRRRFGGIFTRRQEKPRAFDPQVQEESEPPRENALDGVNLHIQDGEVMGVVGPSGCGKSTLLRVIAGLLSPNAGRVLFDGVPMDNIPPVDRGIGMVFQSYALYPHMESEHNVDFFFRVQNREEEIPERVKQISEIMGIGFKPLMSRRPPTLSGGQQQRVAIARCIARDPKLFLFDEPMSNLDAKLRVETRYQIKKLLTMYAITSIYVTHDQVEVNAMSDRIAVMHAGKIEQVGDYMTLYDDPDSDFVAGFFGTPPMSIFEGAVNAERMWVGEDFSWGPVPLDVEPGTPLKLGIRPEHMELRADGALSGEIFMIEPHFDEGAQYLHVVIGADTECVVKVPVTERLFKGQTVPIGIPPDRVYFFDGETGDRLRS